MKLPKDQHCLIKTSTNIKMSGFEKGLISFWFLSCPSSFRIAPPLTITDEEIDQALAVIGEAIGC
jgi:4-aminobutyrate aminotransferase-like enzyme